jgi:hypothetical protein
VRFFVHRFSQNAIQLHRLTCCGADCLTEWYHTCLLCIVPTLPMCKGGQLPTHLYQQSGEPGVLHRMMMPTNTPYRRSLRPQLCIHANHTLIICSPLRSCLAKASCFTMHTVSMHCIYASTLRPDALPDLPAGSFGIPCQIWVRPTDAPGQTPLTPPSSGLLWTKYPTSTSSLWQ